MGRVSSAERRSALVQAALRVIHRDGVNGATTRAIVAEAGMSLASFHYAFRSRDEMIRELIAFVVQDEQRVSLEALDPDADTRSAVSAGMHAYFDLLRAHPSRERALQELVQYSLRTPDWSTCPAPSTQAISTPRECCSSEVPKSPGWSGACRSSNSPASSSRSPMG